MLKQLMIDNFRGVRQMKVPLEPVTAFLGPNSSGKTTVLHAVRMGCALLERAILSDAPARVIEHPTQPWIAVTADTLLTDGAQQLSLADWQALFVDQSVGENVAASIRLSFEASDPIQDIQVSLRCARNAQIKLEVRVRAQAAVAAVLGLPKKSFRISEILADWLRDRAPRAVFVPPFYGTVPSEEFRSRAVIDRMLGAGDQSHAVRNLVASLTAEQVQQLSSFLEDVVGARIVERTSGDALQTEPTLRVMFTDTNGPLELSAAGAGLVNLVALYSALSRWRTEATRRTVLFLVDEPEAHLSPRVQAQTAARLAALVTQEFSAQLLFATHSVDILNRLYQDGAQLVRCDRKDAERSAVVLASDAGLFEDLADWVDLTPYTAINFLAGRRVVFVEGASEVALLPILGELRYRNDPAKLRAFRQWAVVPLDGASKANQPALLSRLLRSRAIQARVADAPFEVLVVLDRDYERTPGLSAETVENGVRHATVVWPAHSIESLLVRAPVLIRWLRAFLGSDSPSDLDAIVAKAIEAADTDPELCREAVNQMALQRIRAAMTGGQSLLAEHGRAVKDATDAAQRLVQSEPALWQRGKDRARVVLTAVRAALPPGLRAHLPTDGVRLVQAVDLSRIGTPLEAIPEPIRELFEKMVDR